MSPIRIIKEPLIHFVLIGAALFALYARVNPDEKQASANAILVSAGRIGQLTSIFAKTWQRPPSEGELKGLIDDFILEEIYYRKAIEMGIDQDDTVIRRRLRQKIEFLTDDTVALATPGDEELERYLTEHAEEFRTDPVYTFRQIYFNPEKHGDEPLLEINRLAGELRAGADVSGDPTLLPEGMEDASARIIDGTLGTGFAAQLADLVPGEWSPPLMSGFGLHLVRIDKVTQAELPSLEEIRPIVEREWANERRVEGRAAFNKEWLREFEIEIEWPVVVNDPEPNR